MRIKRIFKYISSVSHLLVWVMAIGYSSCTTDSLKEATDETEEALCHTYAMRFEGTLQDFGQGTRAAHTWSDGSKLYLQFFENDSRITGTATLSVQDDVWTVKTTKPLTAPDKAYCEAYYFVDPAAALSSTVSMDLTTVVYADKAGSYILEEDDAIAVTASLSPLTGRIRFVGTPEAEYIVSGLSTFTSYAVGANTFASSSRKLSVVMDDKGSSDYFYALFDDEHQLVVNGEGKSAYMRTFADYVLAAGSSGFVTLPSTDELGSWALVNADNLQEIVLPEVSAVSVSTIRSKSAGATATVTTLGNGTLLESGIVCSTNATPTLDNGTCYDANKSRSISLRVKSLQPETYYYVRAYARNERGMAWGETVKFKTISEAEDGSSFGKEGFGDSDDDLNNDVDDGGSGFGKEGFGDDEDNLNTDVDDGGSGFGKEGFGDDEDNLDTDVGTDSSGFGKEGFGDDEDNLNTDVGTDSSGFGKEGFGDDEDNLNTDVGTDSSGFGKEGFGDDEDNLNTDVGTDSSGFGKSGYGDDEDWN